MSRHEPLPPGRAREIKEGDLGNIWFAEGNLETTMSHGWRKLPADDNDAEMRPR